jgi:D-galactarolactone cycloisomerase
MREPEELAAELAAVMEQGFRAFKIGWGPFGRRDNKTEPLQTDALSDYQILRRSSRVSIAGGEVLTRRQSFAPWLESGALDIVQPDVTKCGGLSEQRRIAWKAREHGVRFIPHGWNTAIGLASDLQIASAFPETNLVEYLTGSPFIDELAADGWHLDPEGLLPVPHKPGLGVEINLEALCAFTRANR